MSITSKQSMKTRLKDWPKIYLKLKGMKFAHDDERILYARGLAATSQERWEMHENFMRLNGCWGWTNRRRFWQLRKKLNDTTRPGLWKLRLTNSEMVARHGFEP